MLKHWAAIVGDFQEFYGLDLSSGVLAERSWHWFADRITGLLTKPPVVSRLSDGKLNQIPQTRLGFALNPPKK